MNNDNMNEAITFPASISEPTRNEAPARILIIEDDRFIGEMYERTLREAGYEVDIAIDGAIGFSKIKSGQFDLVLLDIMLPGKMGDQILHDWRQIQPKSTRPSIIVMTNFEQDEISRAAMEAEADAYLIKADITPRKLREIVEQVLTQRRT
ncbi:response regulator [Candidatus Saccharibacteria bacterium]|nr:response regulator [Candidatus Saccharibacteria bacterium]